MDPVTLQIWDRAEGAKILLFLGPEMRFYKGKWYNEVQKQSDPIPTLYVD